MMTSIVIGAVFSIIFHVGVTESSHGSGSPDSHNPHSDVRIGCLDWLKEPQFYLVLHIVSVQILLIL